MDYPSLVIFDMDGLMFDTESLTIDAWNLGAAYYGFDIDRSIIEQFIGITNQDIINKMAEIYGQDAPVAKWRSKVREFKNQLTDEKMHQPRFKKEGLDSLLVYLKASGVKTAVASSSDKQRIQIFLQATNTGKYIDYCISGEEVMHGKPHPEIFLKSCKKANVQVDEALVLEDSPAGIHAAYMAQIPSIFIPDTVKETEELAFLATAVLPNLSEVKNYLCSIKN